MVRRDDELPSVNLGPFRGLDLRPLNDMAEPNALIACRNISINTAREIESRDQLRKVTDLDPLSRGLYVLGDSLRAALPWRPEAPVQAGPVTYDLLDDKNRRWATPGATRWKRLTGVTASQAYDQRPYLVVAYDLCNAAGVVQESGWEHHWLPLSHATLTRTATCTNGQTRVVIPVPTGLTIAPIVVPATVRFVGAVLARDTYTVSTVAIRDPGDDPNAVVLYLSTVFTGPTGSYTASVSQSYASAIELPFVPGPAAVVAASKVFATRRGVPDVPFSSTLNGPTNWTELDDAGFLATSRNVDGQQEIQGLGVFDGQLVVFFKSASQVWSISPDPAQHRLVGSIGGAGCLYPRSIANAMGDLIYFSNGVFRLASAVLTTGQKKEGDIGAPIAPLTRGIALDAKPVAVWSAYRQQYIDIVGTTAYVLTLSPESGVREWTTWTLPFEVEDIVEHEQQLFLRRAGTPELWVFDPAHRSETGYRWAAQTAFTDLEAPSRFKSLQQVAVTADATVELYAHLDPAAPETSLEVGEVPVDQYRRGIVVVPETVESVSFRLEGGEPTRVGQLTVRYRVGGLV